MANAARAILRPRYGSAADLASYAGLSVKMIRRLLIPVDDLDRHILRIEDHRRPEMATAHQVGSPYRSVDARGRAIPLAPEEARRRAEEGIRALDALLDMGDEAEQAATFAAVAAAIDEDRLSDRKRFR